MGFMRPPRTPPREELEYLAERKKRRNHNLSRWTGVVGTIVVVVILVCLIAYLV